MTRKDYELIAKAINEQRKDHERRYGDRWYLDGRGVVGAIADALEADNPRFDRACFVDATGVDVERSI